MPQPLVLVVDDSPTVRKIVELSLQKMNVEVISASDGLTGLTLINERQPDLILLDVILPRMDGYSICHAVRNNIAFNDVPIIMLSGKGHFVDKVKGRWAGAQEYLTKPFDTNELVSVVMRHLKTQAAYERAKRREAQRMQAHF